MGSYNPNPCDNVLLILKTLLDIHDDKLLVGRSSETLRIGWPWFVN
jgi:hypothetical protein